ncbi:hypothetical protein KA344_12175, partial [bacterium]|nr:hypothetical protein [bacterium]
MAASMLLLISAPQLFQVRAYAQYHDQPATVNTVPQNFSLDAGSNIQTVAGIGAGLPQSVIITTADKLPSGTSTDSQSGSGNNAPAVPPTPGMASVDAVGGLIPVVSGITLTPDVPTLVNAAVAPASLPSASSVTASSPGSSPTDVAAPSSGPTASLATIAASDASTSSVATTAASDASTSAVATTASPDASTSAVATTSAPDATTSAFTTTAAPDASSSAVATTAAPDASSIGVTTTAAPDASSTAAAPAAAVSVVTTTAAPDSSPNAVTTTEAPESSTVVATVATVAPDVSSTLLPAHVTITSGTVFGSGLGLDLSSSTATISAPIDQPVTITVGGSMDLSGSVVGGTSMTIQPGQMITASQYVALTQVVGQGSQSIVLDQGGASQAGNFILLANQTDSLSSLVLPVNVTLSGVGFSSADPFVVNGTTSILGSFYALQDNSSTSSILNFGNLTVGGLLTASASNSPAITLPSSVTGLGLFSSTGLSINTTGFLNNTGIISSPGFLNITAGSNIANSGMLSGSSVALTAGAGINNSGNIFASAGNIGLNSLTGNFVNSGMINAIAGSVNINSAAAAMASNVIFNNAGGSIAADSGSINFRTTDFMDKADLKIDGGSLSAKTVELNGGRGEVEVNVANLGGTVNSSAYIVKLASASDITIGNTTANGDPTIVSTTGNITIAGNQITGGAPLSVIAYGDIVAGPGINIQTSGGEVFMASGVNIQDGGGVWRITGPASPNGGVLDLRGVTTLSTAGATGGNVTLVAYDGGNIDSGRVLFAPTTNITTAGTAGASGNVRIIAADLNSAGQQSIITGTIDTRGAGTGTIGTGSVLLAAASLPDTVNVTVDKATGAAAGLNQFVPGGGLPRDINVNGDIITRGAAVSLIAGNATSVTGNILVTGAVDNRISSTGAGVGNGGSFTVLQNSANTFVVGGATVNGIGAASGAIQTQAGTGGGKGGTVDITNNGPGGITANLGSVATPIIDTRAFGTSSGGSFILSAPAGPITLTSTGNAVNANAAGGNSIGGTIQIVGQTFTASGNPNLNAFGTGPGAGGTVTVQSTQAGNDITVGTTSPDIRVNVSGGPNGAAGTVNLSAGGNLVVNTVNLLSTTGNNQKGATLNFNSGLGGAGITQIIGSLDVSGNGTGSGGTINLSTNSGSAFTVSGGPNGVTGTLKADSGATGGNGGTINIKNSGTGGITVTNASSVSVAPLANGAGGTLILDAAAGATPGVVSLAGGTYNASALGGNNNGGTITVKGSQTIATGAAPVTILADASGTGNGGTAQLIATAAGSTATIGNAAGQFILDARGGSVGSASGN